MSLDGEKEVDGPSTMRGSLKAIATSGCSDRENPYENLSKRTIELYWWSKLGARKVAVASDHSYWSYYPTNETS